MHLVDITMFYAAEGGGVSTYLNAKAHWLARRSRVRHTIMSSNVETCDHTVPALVKIPSAGVPGFHGFRMPLSVAGPARLLESVQPDVVEAGDAGHCAWAALRMRKRYAIPAAYLRYEGSLLIGTQFRWGRNLRTGEPVAIRYMGRKQRADVEVIADEDGVVRFYGLMCRHNDRFADLHAIGFDQDGAPNEEDLRQTVKAGSRVIKLTPR